MATLAGHAAPVNSVAWSPDGKTLASGSADKTVKLWEGSSGKLLATLLDAGPVFSVAWSPDGKMVASGSWHKTVKLWEASSGKLLVTLAGHADRVFSVAFSPDGKTVASGSADKTVKLWEASSGKLLVTLAGHADRVFSVAWSPDGKTVASGSADKTVKSGNISAGNSKRFGRFDDYFLPQEQWAFRRETFFQRSGLPSDPKEVAGYLKARLNRAYDLFPRPRRATAMPAWTRTDGAFRSIPLRSPARKRTQNWTV